MTEKCLLSDTVSVTKSSQLSFLPLTCKLCIGEEEDTPFPTKVQFPAQKNVKISQCLAGYLISIALDFNEDKIYTWGYAGRGILGRVVQNNNKTPEKTSLKLCKSQVIQKYKTKVLREIMGENALTKLQCKFSCLYPSSFMESLCLFRKDISNFSFSS